MESFTIYNTETKEIVAILKNNTLTARLLYPSGIYHDGHPLMVWQKARIKNIAGKRKSGKQGERKLLDTRFDFPVCITYAGSFHQELLGNKVYIIAKKYHKTAYLSRLCCKEIEMLVMDEIPKQTPKEKLAEIKMKNKE